MAPDVRIDALCRAVGIALDFTDALGAQQNASESGKRLALEALGFPTGNDDQIADSIARIKKEEDRPLARLLALEEGRPSRLRLRAPAREWTLRTEAGETFSGDTADATTINLPALAPGYHALSVQTRDGAADATILAAPRRCYMTPSLTSGGKAWGATAQVYSLRGDHDLGIGTYADVAKLADALGARGASFLGLSPVHALFGTDPSKFSPYSPSSRLFLQTGLIAPHLVPGFDAALDGAADVAPDGALIDYATVLPRQRAILDAIWTRTRDVAAQDTADFRREGGTRLEEYATFEALCEHFKAQGLHGIGDWPAAYRDVHSPEVATSRNDHAERVAFHIWLQWLADCQLSHASSVAREKGMSIGLYRDLAVGADRGGAEYWSEPDQFVDLSVGAPPDLLGPKGQDWGLPPLNPLTLASSGLAAFRELVVANMRHAGAVRIDHAFQLQRLFVIPIGGEAKDGVYLSYPLDAILASLKIESHRARCVVIGEDLGTAPAGFSDKIMDAGILSYRLLSFERGEGGIFKEPASYPKRALAALSTHDLPTFAGWWRGVDVEVRECLGVFTPEKAYHERAAREDDRRQLATALMAEGLDASTATDQMPDVAALRYLARTPSVLVAVQLEDVLREHQQANLPGPDCGHPNWRRRSSASVEEIANHPGLDRVAAAFREDGRSLTSATPHNVPSGTYRLQLHAKFSFDDAAATVPYLARLGISHVYVSPIQMASPGSTHGYDIVDPSRLNPELGGEEAFERFSDALHAHGLRLMVDIVPNHVGVGGKNNPWWLELLEWGRLSPHAETFDIDWNKPGADGKLIVPFLGEPFDDLLDKRHIGLGFEAPLGRFAVWYSDHCHPVSPLDYAELLGRARVNDEEGANTLRALAADFAELRLWDEAQPAGLLARGALLRRQLAAACAANHALRIGVERVTAELSNEDLRALCVRQAWRLVFWADANQLINYRRFFDITSLAGVRIEDPRVLEASHKLIFDLVDQGRIHALRVDHVDGLADPTKYLERLQERVGPDFYVVVEKIIEPGEHLPQWPIAGTTGYDALHSLDAVFFAKGAMPALDRLNREIEAQTERAALDLFQIKSALVEHTFVSEFEGLLADLEKALDGPAPKDLALGLRALLAAFPVYRTYATGKGFSDQDRNALDEARHVALEKLGPDFRPTIETILKALEKPGRALRRFQQLTGPLMAKSFEDTLFYRHARFIAANEVGCGPDHPGIEVAAFHRGNVERLIDWPASLIATSTHDTKRGEDARGRLLAASHLPDAWKLAWERFKASPGADGLALGDVYFLFQSLIAACPIDPTEAERKSFVERGTAFVEKFLREGKLRSKWTSPDADYEKRARAFVEQCAAPQGILFKDLVLFVRAIALAAGRFAVARTVLKCTMPGVPDIYQGSELLDLSFVDPDNRRPVDYEARATILGADDDVATDRAFLSGDAKLHTLARLLQDRRDNPVSYGGGYAPAKTTLDDGAIAYLRGNDGDALFVAVQTSLAPNADGWRVSLPAGEWRNLFDGRTLQGDRMLGGSELFGLWPAVAMRRAG